MSKAEPRFNQAKQLLSEQFGQAFIALNDESEEHLGHAGAEDGASHYELVLDRSILSQYGNLINLHRAVYETLGTLIPKEIHALRVRLSI